MQLRGQGLGGRWKFWMIRRFVHHHKIFFWPLNRNLGIGIFQIRNFGISKEFGIPMSKYLGIRIFENLSIIPSEPF
jgi:hypothetical protein